VHNSRRPLNHLILTLTFDLIYIGGRGIVMDYPRATFGNNFSFSCFGFIVQTDRITEDNCYIHATTDSMSNEIRHLIEGCNVGTCESEIFVRSRIESVATILIRIGVYSFTCSMPIATGVV